MGKKETVQKLDSKGKEWLKKPCPIHSTYPNYIPLKHQNCH